MCAHVCDMSLHREVSVCKGAGSGFPLAHLLVKILLVSQGSYQGANDGKEMRGSVCRLSGRRGGELGCLRKDL